MPAPPPESDPAMISTRPCILFRCLSPADVQQGCLRVLADRGVANCDANLVHHRRNHLLVFALSHDADHRLGSGFADYEPPVAAEPFFTVSKGVCHRGYAEGVTVGKAHAAQQLWHRSE